AHSALRPRTLSALNFPVCVPSIRTCRLDGTFLTVCDAPSGTPGGGIVLAEMAGSAADGKSPRPFGQGPLSFTAGYDMIWLGVVDKRQAVCPSGPTLCGQGRFFALLTVRKGGTG